MRNWCLCAVALWAACPAQAEQLPEPFPTPVPRDPISTASGTLVLGLRTNAVPDFRSLIAQKTNLFQSQTNAGTNNTQPRLGFLPPGVYETKPYTMIVVAPGPMRDDAMMQGRPGTPLRMPHKEPKLEFVPRGTPWIRPEGTQGK